MFLNALNLKFKLYKKEVRQDGISINVNKLIEVGEYKCNVYSKINRTKEQNEEYFKTDLTLICEDVEIVLNDIIEFEGTKYKVENKKIIRPFAPHLKNQGIILYLVKRG